MAPTRQSTPFGRRAPRSPSQSGVTKTVERMKSRVDAAERRAFGSRVARKWCAPKRAGLRLLVGGRREGRHLAAHGAGELQGEVSQAADPDDADPHGRLHPAPERRVDGGPAAQERRGVLGGERLGDGEREAAVEPDAVGEAAVVADAGGDVARAQVLVAGDAGIAGEAGAPLPADPDPRADLQVPDLGPDGRDRADDLVAGDHRVAPHAPVAVHEVDVAVADAAVADPDLDVVGPQGEGLVHERLESALLRVGGVGVEAHASNLPSPPPRKPVRRSNIARMPPTRLTRADAEALDAADELASLRGEFLLPEGVVYLDGNSLGALPRRTVERVREVVEREWGRDLIRSWNANGWIDLPARVAGLLAPLVGASADEVAVADSTSVNVFKLLAGGLRLRPGRRVILSEEANFPTDLYVAQGLARLLGDVELRLVATRRPARRSRRGRRRCSCSPTWTSAPGRSTTWPA